MTAYDREDMEEGEYFSTSDERINLYNYFGSWYCNFETPDLSSWELTDSELTAREPP